jgi:hypothetical protein
VPLPRHGRRKANGEAAALTANIGGNESYDDGEKIDESNYPKPRETSIAAACAI